MKNEKYCFNCGWGTEFNNILIKVNNKLIHEDSDICDINNRANELTDKAFGFIGK